MTFRKILQRPTGCKGIQLYLHRKTIFSFTSRTSVKGERVGEGKAPDDVFFKVVVGKKQGSRRVGGKEVVRK